VFNQVKRAEDNEAPVAVSLVRRSCRDIPVGRSRLRWVRYQFISDKIV